MAKRKKRIKEGKGWIDILHYNSKKKRETQLKSTLAWLDFSAISSSLKKIYDSKLLRNIYLSQYTNTQIVNTGRGKILYMPDAEKEIRWSSAILLLFSESISDSISQEENLSRAILEGLTKDISSSLDYLKTHCNSFTFLELNFLLHEQVSGNKGRIELFEFLAENKASSTILSLAHFASQRADRDLNIFQYRSSVTNTLNSNKNRLSEDDKQFYKLKFDKYNIKELTIVNKILSKNQIISPFDLFKTIVTSTRCFLELKDDENLNLLKGCWKYIKKLNSKFASSELKTISAIYDPTTITKLSERDLVLNKLDELFRSGKYEDCLSTIEKNNILINNAFITHIIKVKCKIKLDRPFYKEENPRLISSIETNLRDLFSFNNQYSLAKENLRKISYNLQCLSIGGEINSYLENWFNDSNEDKDTSRSLYLWSSTLHPFIALAADNIEKSKDILSNLHRTGASRILIDLARVELSEELEDISILDKLDSLNKTLTTAKLYKIKSEWVKVFEVLDYAIENTQIAFELEELMLFKYDSLVDGNYLNESIEFYLKCFTHDPRYVERFNTKKVKSIIKKGKFRNVSAKIVLPIFYFLSNADDYEVYTSYSVFLKSLKVNKPVDFINRYSSLKDSNREEYIAFLHRICVPEIMKHSIHFYSSDEKFIERITILNHLIEIDAANSDEYKKELDELSQQIVIQQGLKEIDESKIFVNERGILSQELKGIDANFSKYVSLGEMNIKGKILKLLQMNPDASVSIVSLKEGKIVDEKLEYSDDPQYDMFVYLFYEIREKFLLSKYGLVAYLSTRIRHGVLLGQLRTQFSRNNLVSQFSEEINDYLPITFWTNKINSFDPTLHVPVQKAFSNFSRKIDEIINKLLTTYLQIETEQEKSDSLFNYYFDDNHTYSLFSTRMRDIRQLNKFLGEVTDELWRRTDENLEKVRHLINGQIKQEFLDAIETLETNLSNHLPKLFFQDLYNNIASSQTQVQTDLGKVSRWFFRSNRTVGDFSIEKSIDLALHNTNSSTRGDKLTVIKSIQYFNNLKGEFLLFFVDLFRIFFENIILYNSNNEELICFLSVTKHNSTIEINISNKLSPNINKEEFRTILEKTSKLYSTDEGITQAQKDKKSGFAKAFRTVRFDLKNDKNSIDFNIDEMDNFNSKILINISNLENEEGSNN
ncbi:hypothetical protein [Rufibacter ruber]|uniref:hypothetical protein n=1 Tax=Rufibacter ruber TaxID=1783499 RepID=UPI0008347F58|nr:hypothetical protein [Rufibacter ruber]